MPTVLVTLHGKHTLERVTSALCYCGFRRMRARVGAYPSLRETRRKVFCTRLIYHREFFCVSVTRLSRDPTAATRSSAVATAVTPKCGAIVLAPFSAAVWVAHRERPKAHTLPIYPQVTQCRIKCAIQDHTWLAPLNSSWNPAKLLFLPLSDESAAGVVQLPMVRRSDSPHKKSTTITQRFQWCHD